MIEKIKKIYSSQSDDVKGLAKGVFWSALGSIISKGFLFIAWILIARILGKELYGEYGLIRNTILMFATFAGFGMGITGMKFISEYIDTDKSRAGRVASLTLSFSLVLGMILTVVVILFSNIIAEKTIGAPWLRDEFIVSAFILLFCAYNGAQIGILNGLKRFKDVAKIHLWNSVISLPIFIVGAYKGVMWSVVAYGISHLLLCIQTEYFISCAKKRGEINIRYSTGWREWKLLYQYSLPAALSGLMIMPIKWGSSVMLVNYSGFSTMGIFTAAFTIYVIISAITNMMSSPFISFMSSSNFDSNIIAKLNVLAPWLLTLLICIPFLCFPYIGEVVFGKDYQGDEFNETFLYIILFTLVIMYNQGVERILAVKNMQWIRFLSNMIWGIVLLGVYCLLREEGSVGLSKGYLAGYLVVTMIVFPICIVKRYIPKEFIFSRYVILMWCIVIALTYLTYIELHIVFRILCCVMSIVAVIIAFRRMLRSKEKYYK